MRYTLLYCLLVSFLSAKSTDTCYSVQVKSFRLKHNSSYDFHRKGYPSSCKLMKLNSMYAVRCGCFYNYNDAENALNKLSDIYYDAIIVNTYSYRFGNRSEERDEYQEPVAPKKEKRESYNSSNDSFYKRYNSIKMGGDSEVREDNSIYHNTDTEDSFNDDSEDEDDLSEYGYE